MDEIYNDTILNPSSALCDSNFVADNLDQDQTAQTEHSDPVFLFCQSFIRQKTF